MSLSKFFDGMHGVVFPFAGSAAPTGFLMCDGAAVSRTTYAALFLAIGTTFGAGDGSTTFNIPDLRGRTIAGKDNMGGVAANRLTNTGTGNPGIDGTTLGAAGGADRHQLTTPQMPAHTHLEYSWNAAGSAQTGAAGGNFGTQQTGSAGGNEAHPNVQPTMVMNWIIRA